MKKLGFILVAMLAASYTHAAFADWACTGSCMIRCDVDSNFGGIVTSKGATKQEAITNGSMICQRSNSDPQCFVTFAASSCTGTERTRPQYYTVIFKNECRTYGQITTAIRYRNLQNTWVSGGFWTIAYGESATVAHTTNRIYYTHGHTATGQIWAGSDTFEVRGNNYAFHRWTIPEGTARGTYVHRFTCN